MKHDIPVERLLELSLLRDIWNEETRTIRYYKSLDAVYNSPYDLNKMRLRIWDILDEFLDDYKIENYANLTESKD